ncbi:MAG: hypothetical protein KGM43_00865 [Planctomycetota bacterium]|nr:hypothetical protein [Planctomycetota bacterium]
MYLSHRQGHEIAGGVFLVGFGILFLTGFWWPGLIFVVGGSMIIEGLVSGRGRFALAAGLWPILFGVWALFHYSPAAMFVGIGLGSILSVFLKTWNYAKPAVDHSLD